ncbi:hypothetical protein SVAN01_09178 [Stagonosporopsis vannaccii]|nr:hypothetical protein SVAN01_09178 [Stagonosporopsis vannaccii]
MPSTLLPRNDSSAGTVAVVIFIAGACILVLLIILILIFFKKRHARSSKNKNSTFIPRLERRGPNYGKLEDDEEGAWSTDMGGHDGVNGANGNGGKGGYAPVHDESMGYQSQTMQRGGDGVGREGYR